NEALRVHFGSRDRAIDELDEVAHDGLLRRRAGRAPVASVLWQEHARAHAAIGLQQFRPIVDELSIAMRENHQRPGAIPRGTIARQDPALHAAALSADVDSVEPRYAPAGVRAGSQKIPGKKDPPREHARILAEIRLLVGGLAAHYSDSKPRR